MKINRSGFGIVLYVLVAMWFFFVVLLNRRSYDVWILDGIVVPTIIFVFSSVVVEMFVRDNRKLVLVVAFFIIAINLVTGIKYSLFYGVYDTPAHYRFAQQIALQGRVPKDEFYSNTYGANPGMHIFLASFSFVSGVPFDLVFRAMIPSLFGLVPFFVYLIARRILDETALRYTIIVSGFPAVAAYAIDGTVLAFIPYFLLIAIFLRLFPVETGKKSFFVLFAVSSFALVISHGVTPFFVSLLLIGSGLLFELMKTSKKADTGSVRFSVLSIPFVLYLILLWVWWTNTSMANLNFLVEVVKSLWLPNVPAIPTRFFQIPLLSRLQVLFVLNSANATVAILSLLGMFILIRQIRRRKLSHKTATFYLHIVSLFGTVAAFLFLQFASNFGSLSYERLVVYAIPFCFFLAGTALANLDRLLRVSASPTRRLIFTIPVFVLVFTCIFQFLPFQPLVPQASVLSESLPSSAYIVDLTQVNTVYQRAMILFAENHSVQGSVVSDIVTRTQLYGFASPQFFSRVAYESPLIPDSGRDLKWDLFLLHTSKGGPFYEKVEYRTEDIISGIRLGYGNSIYDNGESFILSHSR